MANVVLTGASRGIGLQLARKYAARLDTVYACTRGPCPELEEIPEIQVIEGVDVSEPSCLEELGRRLSGVDIDILVNNAGILHVDDLGNLDFESLRRQMEVNAFGPLRVTKALLPNIVKPGGKIAIISSRMGSIADNTSGGMYGYRMSKAAVNMAGASLARDLKGDGIAVAILHPGFVRTEMTNNQGSVHPADAARGLIERIEALDRDNSGTFWHMNGEVLPW